MTGGLPALAVSRPILIAVVNLLIVIAGLAAALAVEVRELPNVDRAVVTVRAQLPGAAPETMDAEVTSVIEGAMARVNGVMRINAASEEGTMRARATFRPGVDLDVAANDVREAVAGVARDLPDGVEQLTVVKADADSSPVLRLALASDRLPREALTRLAEEDVAVALSAVPGVAAVELFGDEGEVLRIVIDPLRLASFDLVIDDVAAVLAQASLDIPAGSFKSDDHMLLVRADASVWRPAEIEALRLRPDLPLGDVAQAFYGPADPTTRTLLNGRQIVGLAVIKRAQSNTIAISDGVGRAVARINARLRDADLAIVSDDARFIRGAVAEVVTSLLIAAGVVVLVVYAFLGSLRATLLPAVAMPVAIIGALAAIHLAGFSVNILTLLALVLATGLIVDDAIVVAENIARQRRLGAGPMAAAVLGSRQVFFAVIATTATLVSVFLPIAALPGQAGRLFTEFGVVLAVAVAISSFVALTLVPMLAARIAAGEGAPPKPLRALGGRLAAGYERLLDFTLRARALTLGLAVIAAALAGASYADLDQELLPREDRGLITISMQGPDGVGLEYMDRQSAQAEALLQPWLEDGVITSVMAIVGRWDPNRVFIIAPMADWADREISQNDLAQKLNAQLAGIPGARGRVWQSNSLGLRRSGGSLEFALTGPDHATIAAAADDFVALIRARLPILTDPQVAFQQTQPQLTLAINRSRAEALGVPVEAVSTTLRAMVDGLRVVDLNVNDRLVPVTIVSAAGAIDDPGDLDNLFIRNGVGALVPLSAFAGLTEAGIAAELDRVEQRRAVEIEADLAEGAALGEAVAAVQALALEALPSGIDLRLLNEAADLGETTGAVALTFGLALLIVFLVLAAQFESPVSALVILTTVPFGLAAALFALALTGVSLNIYSQIGLVILVGLMAKNGILVVEFADQLRDQGCSVREAVRESALIRLRPVMMTMLSTVLSAVPLILASGAGAEARAAIGWVVFGGLGLATVFTLILIPVVYSLLSPLAKPRAHAGVRLNRELRAAGDASTARLG